MSASSAVHPDVLLAVAALLVAAAVLLWPVRRGLAALRRPGAGPPTARAETHPGSADIPVTVVMDLVAAAMAAGLPAPDAVAAAARAAGPGTESRLAGPLGAWRLGVPAEVAWAGADERFVALARALVLAERTGGSAAVLLSRAASDARSARQRAARVAARRLGVQLVLPLGLTTLPAFVLWGVAPVVLGLATQLLAAP